MKKMQAGEADGLRPSAEIEGKMIGGNSWDH
ncbi:hypothetical protein N182_26850 [Sinorhizobium sp. GL2]|nr:hypothetical protein N182_26850 [Sinorhizobium sp. GL2]